MKYRLFTLLLIFLVTLLFFLTNIQAVQAARECGEGLGNPIGPCDMSILEVLIVVLQTTLGAVGLLAVVMIVYGGLVMLTSGGNPDKVKKAKDTLLWAVLGVAVIIFSGAIIRYIFDNFNF